MYLDLKTLEQSDAGEKGRPGRRFDHPSRAVGQQESLVFPATVGDWRKRVLDIVIASTALILLFPLFLMIAAMIKYFSPGPLVYGHTRVGFGGKPFKCLKFRSMVMDGDAVLERHLASSEKARAEWEAFRKLKEDPRVTPIGAVLRATSADELPQLINVLRGEMSIVGPRPVVHDELRYYGEHSRMYCSTRPGITGLWQVSGRSDVSYEERVGFDRAYCESWSLRRDLLLMVQTVPVVLSRKGTY